MTEVMMNFAEFYQSSALSRILVIIGGVLLAHWLIRSIRDLGEYLTLGQAGGNPAQKTGPKPAGNWPPRDGAVAAFDGAGDGRPEHRERNYHFPAPG